MMNRRLSTWWTLLVVFATLFSGRAAGAVELEIDADTRFQTIEGFGACLVSWRPAMARWYETEAAQDVFVDELGLTILRCSLWGDGTIGPVEDWRQISYKDPAFAAKDRRTPVFVNFAKAIREKNPDVKVIGTVWSPPAWMKESGSITDRRSAAISAGDYVARSGPVNNRVKREYYPHFAKWLVEMVKYYEAHGVPLYAISPANEPQFTQTFESCVWTVPDLITMIKMVGELLEEEGLGHVKIFGPESMTGFNWEGGPNRAFVRQLMADREARDRLFAFATHGYVDGFTADQGRKSSAQFWELIKDAGKPYWMTEGGTGGHEWPEPISEKGVAAGLHNSLVAGNVSAWVPWQFAGPGGDGQHALRPTEGPSKKSWIVRQYARYIRPGATRVAAEPAYGDVNVSAYVGPDNKGLTIVLTNPGDEEKEVQIRLRGRDLRAIGRLNAYRTSATEDAAPLDVVPVRSRTLRVAVPAQSVTTLTTAE